MSVKGKLTLFLGSSEAVYDEINHYQQLAQKQGKKIETIQEHWHIKQYLRSGVDVLVIEEHLFLEHYEEIAELLQAPIDIYTTMLIQDETHPITSLQKEVLFFSNHVIVVEDLFHNANTLQQICKQLYLQWMYSRVENIQNQEYIKEQMLVCISSAQSSEKLLYKASALANARKAQLSALYVVKSKEALSNAQAKQLQKNFALAQQIGAKVEVLYADDVLFQILEYAKLIHATTIVIGRNEKRHILVKKQCLCDQLLKQSEGIDIYSVPVYEKYYLQKNPVAVSLKDIILALCILTICTLFGFLFFSLGYHDSNIIMIYILGVFLIAIISANRLLSLLCSLISVLIFNFFFTFPTLSLSAYDSGYPMTFLIMFIVAIMTSTLASKIQNNALISNNAAKRTKLLLETNQILQKEGDMDQIIEKGLQQVYKLLNRDLVFYPVHNQKMQKAILVGEQKEEQLQILENEKEVATWVYEHNTHAGASTKSLSGAKYMYLALRVNQHVYGVLGINLGKQRLESFEKDVLLAMIGEIAFALENAKSIVEKNQAALLAKNEKLRADLLRSISHDLRTPLTAISGNADLLMSNANALCEDSKQRLYEDIYDDSLWLINLVENLLSVTRIENQTMKLQIEPQIVEDVVSEALAHVSRKKSEHHLEVVIDGDLVMADMDARLIIQVLINLVDNAIKYTPKASSIKIHVFETNKWVVIEVIDDGDGIKDAEKAKIFDKFYSVNETIVDSKRSLGLGLSLCKSIIVAHGGKIEVRDNQPHGACFRFTLPASKIRL